MPNKIITQNFINISYFLKYNKENYSSNNQVKKGKI